MSAPDLLTDVLRSVSRSFYLTVRALPGAIRPQIGLAYLLARATDTIADTELAPVEQRLEALRRLKLRIDGSGGEAPDLAAFAAAGGPGAASEGERALLGRIDEVIGLLERTTAGDQKVIRETLSIIVSGQELDLRRFEVGRSGPGVIALQSEADLDDYTFRVAGCVGLFWTRLCRAHLFPGAEVDEAALLEQGVRFGKGLQLVNILRDLPRDLGKRRCYLPADQLAAVGLAPEQLLDPRTEPRLRPLYDEWCDRAVKHLAAGWSYTNALPGGTARVRLACAWPILIGVETLGRLRRANPLDPTQRIRISRADVRRILIASLARYPFQRSWRRLFDEAAGR